jgi:hypothetical protein
MARCARKHRLDALRFRGPAQGNGPVDYGRGERKKFIDYVHVSQAKKDDGTVVFAILVEVEIKMPAAKKAGKQIGRADARFHLGGRDLLVLEIEVGLGGRN